MGIFDFLKKKKFSPPHSSMHRHNFAFIDIETTGLDVILHEIIEIGVVLTDKNLEIIEEFNIKLKPERISDADKVSLKINHYNQADWENALSMREGMKFFADKVSGAIMVGQNVSFDFAFIEHAFSRINMQNPMHYHKLDTISIAWAKFHNDFTFGRFSLHEMCARFGIKNQHEHAALSDARATYELYKKLMKL